MTKNDCPEFISFDHDLGDVGSKTGKDIANWMVQRDLDQEGKFIPDSFYFNVHSANPVGKENIEHLFDNYFIFRKNN